jgi:hypothetical protein
LWSPARKAVCYVGSRKLWWRPFFKLKHGKTRVSDLFREVDEDVRHERMLKLWRALGPYVIVATVVSVLTVGGYLAWRDYQHRQAEADGARFVAALADVEAGKTEEAVQALRSLANEGGAAYRALARLRAAGLRLDAGDVAAAVALYQELALDGGAEPIWRDLAQLMTAYALFDTTPPEGIIDRLRPLTADSGAWRYSARELSALAKSKAGDPEAAAEFKSLAEDPAAPPGVRNRAAQLAVAPAITR